MECELSNTMAKIDEPPKIISNSNKQKEVKALPIPRKDLTHIDDEDRCEASVWNNGKGGRCTKMFREDCRLACGRNVCKMHKNAIDRCVARTGEEEEDGSLLGWYDNFTTDRHNRLKPLFVSNK